MKKNKTTIQRNWQHRVHKMKKTKTQHKGTQDEEKQSKTPEKLATQSTQDEDLEKLATQGTQDEKTQHNLEKLATQSTQDEENKNTTQPRETGNIGYTR